MMLWPAIALVSLAVLALLLRPLLRREAAGEGPGDEAADRAVYRDQLAELERDLGRGLVAPEAAAAARLEIERRLLATDRAGAPEARQSPERRRGLAAALAILLGAGAALLYLELGSPHLPDRARLAATAPAPDAAEPAAIDPTLAAEAAALAARLDANPSDAAGWARLGNLHLQMARYDAARIALEQAIQQGAPDAVTQSLYGEALTQLDQGSVGPDAATAFRKALAAEPKDPRARYYLGLLAAEEGDFERALVAWRALLAETAADAPWRKLLEQSIVVAERAQGGPPAPPAADAEVAPPAPDADALAAAAAMTPEEREGFIRSMVDGLAERLAAAPDDLEGWQRLAHAYGVLGEAEKARDAWAKAVALAPDRLDLLLDYAGAIVAATPEGTPFGAAFDAAVAKIRASEPGNLAALYFAALGEARHGRPQEARALFEELLEALPLDAPQRRQIEREIEALGAG